MNHLIKKTRIYFVATISLLSSLSSLAGTGSSGGGSGIILKDGNILLVDLVQPQNIDYNMIASEEEISNLFFKKNRYVKKIAEKNEAFFNCAIQTLSKTHLVFKDSWSASLKKVRVLNVEFPLFQNQSTEILENQSLPLFADRSERLQHIPQVALASYNKGDLWVQKRFYQALPNVTACALSLHEAIRHLNFMFLTKKPLSTTEIEEATNDLINNRLADFEHKISSHFVISEELNGVSEFITQTRMKLVEYSNELPINPSSEQLFELSEIIEKLRKIDHSVFISTLSSSKNDQILAKDFLEINEKSTDYTLKYWKFMDTNTQQFFVNTNRKFSSIAQRLLAGSTIKMVSEIKYPVNIFDRILINISLTERLSGLKVLDVKTLKIVNRLF